jgi:O-antigen/teichoic acid export membrane protein
MVSEGTQKMTTAAPEQRGHMTFFRQSGWLMIANIAGGALMWGLHFLARQLKAGEYSTFGALLAVVAVLPTMPLQMVFAQQTARAIATGRLGELVGMLRLACLGIFVLWLIGAGVVFFQQDNILKLLQDAPVVAPQTADAMHGPAEAVGAVSSGATPTSWAGAVDEAGVPRTRNVVAIWLVVFACLLSLWMPIFFGILQGQQNFLWLGWAIMFNGAGRLGITAAAVFLVGGYAAGMISGLVAGLVAGLAIGIWQSLWLWHTPAAPFDWRGLLGQVLPLMLGFGAFQFIFLADMMFVKTFNFTGDEKDAYLGAGTLARALLWLVLPLAAVMFPRMVHSAAKSEKSDLLRTVLLGTLVLAVGGALGLCLVGPFAVRIIYPPRYAEVAITLLPWYAFAMVPLALANVLLNNLLARGAFRVVPVLLVLAVGFGFALTRWHDSQITVLKVLGGFNLLLLAVSAWFSYRTPAVAAPVVSPVPPA